MSLILHLSFGESSGPAPVAESPMVGAYTRMLIDLLPPGKLWLRVGSLLYDLLEACAVELGRLHDRVADLLDEADPSTASELLPEYERELDLDQAPTDDERRARIVALTIADQGYRPVDFQNALAPLLGQVPGDVVVLERSAAFAASIGDVREIFRFFIYRDPGSPGAYFVEAAQEIVDTIKPAHTAGHVIESIAFATDDPFSLTDRDVLGA